MSGYVWGLATAPIALAVIFTCAVVIKGGYLALGAIGKVGVVRLGRDGSDYRFRVGAIGASAKRSILINKGTTGVVFFTGQAHDELDLGAINIYESAIRKADRDIVNNYLPPISRAANSKETSS